jgi:protein TonB
MSLLRPLTTCVFALLAATACRPQEASAPQAPVPAPTPLAALDTPPPQYPLPLACAGVEGQSVLRVQVGVEGKPTAIDLVRGSGNDDLDRLAREAVQGWTFKPATRAGQAVAQTIQVPVNFSAPDVRPDACFALDAGRSPGT